MPEQMDDLGTLFIRFINQPANVKSKHENEWKRSLSCSAEQLFYARRETRHCCSSSAPLSGHLPYATSLSLSLCARRSHSACLLRLVVAVAGRRSPGL